MGSWAKSERVGSRLGPVHRMQPAKHFLNRVWAKKPKGPRNLGARGPFRCQLRTWLLRVMCVEDGF